jgi:hypothetical protein
VPCEFRTLESPPLTSIVHADSFSVVPLCSGGVSARSVRQVVSSVGDARHGCQWETYLNSSAHFTSQPAWMQKLFGAESAATDVASARSAIGIGPAFGRRSVGKY